MLNSSRGVIHFAMIGMVLVLVIGGILFLRMVERDAQYRNETAILEQRVTRLEQRMKAVEGVKLRDDIKDLR